MKYKYWHRITKVNPEYLYINYKVGLHISHEYVKNGRWLLMDMKKGKELWKIETEWVCDIVSGFLVLSSSLFPEIFHSA